MLKFNNNEIDVLITFDYNKNKNTLIKVEIDEDELLNPGILRGLDFTILELY